MEFSKRGKQIACVCVLISAVVGGIIFKIFDIDSLNTVMIKYNGVIELFNVILLAVSLISIIVLVKQIKGEHEKGRREKAIELLLAWTKGITRETNAAKKIVEKFDAIQCRKLFLEENFKVDCKLYDEIVEVINVKPEKPDRCKECTGEPEKDCDGQIILTRDQIKRLRWHIISYLNLLESILVSWQYSVAEREIIEQQLKFMVSPKEGRNVLEGFRIAAGSEDSYPAIEVFCNHMENERKKKLKKKGNLL